MTTPDAHPAEAPGHDTHADAHGTGHHHIPSARLFTGVLVALLFFTLVTVVVSRFDFGGANLLIAMAVAAVKASLVISIFMHLKWDTPINQIVFLGSFLFLSLLLIFTLSDYATRGRANPNHTIKAPVDQQWVHPAKPAGAN